MTKISVLSLFTFIFFICGNQAKSIIDGMKNERELQQDEIASREPLFENSKYPIGYGESNGYSKIGPMYDMSNVANVMKRSLGQHNPNQRQTGIIYGGGKPIGILQPYQESFKFMPIKEERVYALDGGRSNIDQQEPYLNLMYPLARFTRSEDAIRMAEIEAAKAEFLDKHYPSMLVDFKIHNKLHPTGYNAKSPSTFNIKREETNPTNNDMRKKKRESQNPSLSSQKLHKRENQHIKKRDSYINKKQSEEISTKKKRDDKELQKREETSTSSMLKQKSEYSDVEQNKLKMKRQSKISDSEFENLKKSISKRNSNENIQIIEEDLKSLLSDMGLIEDDLEENAEEMEETKSAIVQDEDAEEGFDTVIQKDKEEPQLEQKRDSALSPERRKRADGNKLNAPTRIPLLRTRNIDSKKRTLNNDSANKRSVTGAQDTGKRFIEVSFSSKEDKESINRNANEGDSCPKPSVIPNKREIVSEKSPGNKRNALSNKKPEFKRSEEASMVTTETYEQYEQRVAREIKNKIKQLKEEVKRELGALESDKEEEDDDDSLGESQRKKRFIINTLMDEETHNIDPNENLESSELEPHVRRRRTLSTDMMSSFSSQNSALNSYGKNNIQDINLMNFEPMSTAQNKFDSDIGGYYGEIDGRGQSFINQEPYRKDDLAKKDVLHSNARTRNANDYKHYINSRNYRWDDSPMMYLNAAGNMYIPEYQRRIPGNYVALSSRRNLRNDPNSEGGSFNSDYEGEASNSDSEEEGDPTINSVVDMSRKSVERKSESRQKLNEEHSPKKLQGYNQKYFYYYVGGNENDKKDNMAPPLTNGQRLNPMYNYQRLAGQYPSQFYKTLNRFQGKQYKGTNENGLTNKRAFQRIFDRPLVRRRKRYVNLMIPPREDAIVMNGFFHNSSIPQYSNFRINSPSGNTKVSYRSIMRKGVIEDEIGKDRRNMTSGLSITEKGKNNSDNEVFGRKNLVPWNSSIKKYEDDISETQLRSRDSIERFKEMQLKNEKVPHHNTIFKKQKNTWDRVHFLSSLYNPAFNMNTMTQLDQAENSARNIHPADKSIEDSKTKGSNEGEKFNGRKVLSWLEHGNFPQILQERAETISDSKLIPNKDSSKINLSRNPKNYNIMNETSGYENGEEEEYEENYYSDSTATSTSERTVHPVETTIKVGKVENSTAIPAESSNEIRVSDNIVQGSLSEETKTGRSYQRYIDIQSENFTDLGVEKDNIFVQNASLPSAEWKRRKRDIEPEYHQAVRRKRYWLWPTLSFLRNNAEEEEEFDQNDPSMFQERQGSKRSSDKRFDDDAEEDLEDSANDPLNYERDKRNTETRPFYHENNSPYFYAQSSRNSYIPTIRNRRYINREFREPQQQLLTEISDSELFGALPQSYTGELARYKRVKRTDSEADKT